MIYFKIINNDNSVNVGYCGKYMPVGAVEITEEEYNSKIEKIINTSESEKLYTLDEAAAIIANEVANG